MKRHWVAAPFPQRSLSSSPLGRAWAPTPPCLQRFLLPPQHAMGQSLVGFYSTSLSLPSPRGIKPCAPTTPSHQGTLPSPPSPSSPSFPSLTREGYPRQQRWQPPTPPGCERSCGVAGAGAPGSRLGEWEQQAPWLSVPPGSIPARTSLPLCSPKPQGSGRRGRW